MSKAPARTLVLRPADPFDLIRWLARSQSDPRKAVAELVQNSIDAHAKHDAPGETWRSRFDGERWEVNQMHEDYLAPKGEPRARLRYLVALLAKDLAQHAHRVPGAVEASEDVAAILALVERNLRGA